MKINRPKIHHTIFAAIILIATSTSTVAAQQKYVSPVDFSLLLAGNVGELRTDAFHAGIDIKGMKGIGSPVFAVADGQIWRIGVSPWGYGNVLYIRHNDGRVSVYAHLHEFAPKIAQWVKSQQYAKKSFKVDLYPSASQFVVKQGEKIATVGNSGSSGGAHVHFEIRDSRTGQPMNLLKEGFYTVPDKEKPVLKSVKLYEIDRVNGMEIHRLKKTIIPPAAMNFTLSGEGYLAYELVDYKDGKSNTMGVYSIEQKIDGETNYNFRMDLIDFNKGRYMNAHVAYAEHKASRFDVIRAYVSPNNKLSIYHNVKNRGIITIGDNPAMVETAITDDAGNQTIVNIKITKDPSEYTPSAPEEHKAVKSGEKFGYYDSMMGISIAEESLYDDVYMPFGHSDGVFTVGLETVPLHKSAWLNVVAPKDMPTDKMGLVLIGEGNKISWVGGKYSSGRISGAIRKLGKYGIRQDTIPPVIQPQNLANNGTNLLKFKITDNLSGVSEYTLTIDGKWELAEFDGKTATLTHRISRAKTPVSHEVVLVVTDAVNNKKTFKQTVKW